MKKIIITQQVKRQIKDVSINCPTETGGVLIGTIQQPVVLFAGSPGPGARLRPASFTSDPEHDQMLLRRTQIRYEGRVTLQGYWHKHPSGMSQPSGGDLAQAKELLEKQRDEPNPWILAFIINTDNHSEPNIFPYVLDPSVDGFQKLKMIVADESAVCVQQALRSEPIYVLPEKDDSFWINPGFRFQQTHSGRRRLEQEVKLLEKDGYNVQLQQRKDTTRLSLVIRKAEQSWLCVPPPEYPLCMPRLFNLPDLKEIFPLINRPVWNSDIMLLDFVNLLNPLTVAESAVTDDLTLATPEILEQPEQTRTVWGSMRRLPLQIVQLPLRITNATWRLTFGRLFHKTWVRSNRPEEEK